MNIFYVTSYITERVSKRVIKKENLNNILIISDDRYAPSDLGVEHIKAENIYDLKKPLKNNVIRNWKSILKGNKKISEISNGSFDLYVPNSNIENVKIMTSYSGCESFSYIEEGFTSYCKFGEIETPKEGVLRKMKNYLAYFGLTNENKIFKKGYKKAYGISKYSFPNWERKVSMKPDFRKRDNKFGLKNNYCILVLDSMRNLSPIKENIYDNSLSKAVSVIEDRYKGIYYKMHPDSYGKKEEKKFKNVIKSANCESEEIGQSKPTEKIAIGSELDVVVNLTSTGLYCLLYSDCDVYTFYNIFERKARLAGLEDQNILGFERFVPDVFWDNVKSLGES